MQKNEGSDGVQRKDAFTSVALWQFLAFFIVLCVIWVNEVLDLASLVFGVEKTAFSLYRASVLTAGVIIGAVIAVGHTYEQQRSLVKKLLMTCLYCHRVKTDEGKWLHVVEYFTQNYPVAIDRNACPECQKMLNAIDGEPATGNEADASSS